MAKIRNTLSRVICHPSDDLVTDALALTFVAGPSAFALLQALGSADWKVTTGAIVIGTPALGCAVFYVAARGLLTWLDRRAAR